MFPTNSSSLNEAQSLQSFLVIMLVFQVWVYMQPKDNRTERRENLPTVTMRMIKHTWPRVIGSSLPVGGPGRLPPRVRDENALLYINFHLPCSLYRSTERSTSPPTTSISLAAASAFFKSSSLAARPLFSPETALCNPSGRI